MPVLAHHPCRDLCRWAKAPRSSRRPAGSLPLFRCQGCGSQWVRTEAWTPVDADGTTSPQVQAEAGRRPR